LQAAEQASAGSGEQHRHLAAATRLARESLTEARRSVDALRPEPLERAPFGEALAGVAAKWSALHGIPVQVTTTGAGRPLPPEAEVVLLRTASAGGGFGLLAMRQRVEGLSGTLQVESEPGEGTTISACVPTARAPRPVAESAAPPMIPAAATPAAVAAPDGQPAASPVAVARRRSEVA
jgi:signal transduction histidine kinase